MEDIQIENLSHAIEIISLHNEWRRGAEIEMAHPKILGKAIEQVLDAARKWHNYDINPFKFETMDTAPRDGRKILGYWPGLHEQVPVAIYFSTGGWYRHDTGYYAYPILWSPLPRPTAKDIENVE